MLSPCSLLPLLCLLAVMSVQVQSEEAHEQAMAVRWEVEKVLEVPGCVQWLRDGALPTRPMNRGKRPCASTHGSQTLIMGKLQDQFQTPVWKQSKSVLL